MIKKKIVGLKIENGKFIELRVSIVYIVFFRTRDYIWKMQVLGKNKFVM